MAQVAGRIAHTMRWILDTAGNIVGYRNERDQDVEFSAGAMQGLVSGDEIPSVTYNGAGKVSGFTSDGVVHTVTYPDANTITVTNTLGASRTVAVNSDGRVVAAV